MKKLASSLIASTLLLCLASNQARASQLPNLGSEFRSILSIKDERTIGEFYMSQLRAANLIYPDQLVNEYLAHLGNQLTPYMQMPYANLRVQFFVINDQTINAFAFFDGHVGIHSALILIAENEHELAGVIAHELAHISQQHLLRQMAEQKRMLPLTLAGSAAAVLIGAPDLILPVLAGHMQHSINFTRNHEQEADRIGIKLLEKANFDPRGMSDIFERMSLNLRFEGKLPEYLLTHPLYDSRIADTRHRASSLSYKNTKPKSLMFDLIKERIQVQSTDNLQQLLTNYEHKLAGNKYKNHEPSLYGYAYALMKMNKTTKAQSILSKLEKAYPEELIINLTMAELEEQTYQYQKAQTRLQKLLQLYPDSPSVITSYVQILLQKKEAKKAKLVLERLKNKEQRFSDPAFYELARQCAGQLGDKVAVYEANCGWYVLHGDVDSALKQLDLALNIVGNDLKTKARLEARKQEVIVLKKEIKKI